MDDFEEMGRLLDHWEQEAEVIIDKEELTGGTSELDQLIKEGVLASHGQEIKKWYDDITDLLDNLDNSLGERDRFWHERYDQAEVMLARTLSFVRFGVA